METHFIDIYEFFDFYDFAKRKRKLQLCKDYISKLTKDDIANFVKNFNSIIVVEDDEREISWLFKIEKFDENRNMVFISWNSFVS